jgi:hypothetical protein
VSHEAISYARHRFPPDVIRHAVRLYLRFTLSYRDVEDLLAERGLIVSNDAIRRWVLKFRPVIARNLRAIQPKAYTRWHLDEMVVSLSGKQMYMWRAVDGEGEVLEILVRTPARQGRGPLLIALLCRVEIRSDRIDIALSRSRLNELFTGSLELKIQHRGSPTPSADLLTLTVPASLKRAGREMRLLVENAGDQTSPDPSLLRILARVHDAQARLIQNPTLSVHDIAREEHVSAAYLYTLLRLRWLAPDITAAIINGRKPPQLTAQQLMRLTPRLPANWAEQRKLLDFR